MNSHPTLLETLLDTVSVLEKQRQLLETFGRGKLQRALLAAVDTQVLGLYKAGSFELELFYRLEDQRELTEHVHAGCYHHPNIPGMYQIYGGAALWVTRRVFNRVEMT